MAVAVSEEPAGGVPLPTASYTGRQAGLSSSQLSESCLKTKLITPDPTSFRPVEQARRTP